MPAAFLIKAAKQDGANHHGGVIAQAVQKPGALKGYIGSAHLAKYMRKSQAPAAGQHNWHPRTTRFLPGASILLKMSSLVMQCSAPGMSNCLGRPPTATTMRLARMVSYRGGRKRRGSEATSLDQPVQASLYLLVFAVSGFNGLAINEATQGIDVLDVLVAQLHTVIEIQAVNVVLNGHHSVFPIVLFLWRVA